SARRGKTRLGRHLESSHVESSHVGLTPRRSPGGAEESDTIMVMTRKTAFWGIGLIGILALGSGLAIGMKSPSQQPLVLSSATAGSVGQEPGDESQIVIKTIKPKRNPSFVLSIRELAYVEPYYQAPLLSQVAGRVKFIQKDIGDPITEGEVLVVIDAPDLV